MIPSILPIRSSVTRRMITFVLAGACAASTLALPTSGGREDTGFRITDTASGRTLIAPNGATIISDTTARTNITVESVEGGLDVTVQYTNTGGVPLPLGQINIGGIRLGPVITRKEMIHDTRESVINSQSLAGAYGAPSYPDDTYSPVSVFSDDNYNFGASICYPVEDYDHRVDMFLTSRPVTAWGGSAHWQLSFRLWTELPAGQTRTYKVTLRFNPKSSHWLETLKPYREYFNGLYGDVRYTRDPRPVRTFSLAYLAYLTDSNRRGFYNAALNPELNGYGPWVNHIRSSCEAAGFERTMIWAVSGLYHDNLDDNYPCMIMTGADPIPIMASTQSSFAAIPAAGIDLGFWNGYSSSVSPGGWDTGHVRVDPDNPEHMALVLEEFDRMAALGTKTVGLDAFGWELTPGRSLRLLKLLKQRYPQMQFVTECSLGDIYHVYAPTFEFAHQVIAPNLMADFLLPGNETWLLTDYDGNDDGALLDQMRHYARMGYVPLTSSRVPPTPDILAAETWLELPESVRSPRQNQNARANDGSMAAGIGGLLTRTRGGARGGNAGGGTGPEIASRSGSSGSGDNAASNAPANSLVSNAPTRQRVTFRPSANGEAIPVVTGPTTTVLATGTDQALAAAPANSEKPMISSEVSSGAAQAPRTVSTVTGSQRVAQSKGSAIPPSAMKRRIVPFVAAGTAKKHLEFSAKDARKAVLPNLQQASQAVNRVRNMEDTERQNASADDK